MALRASTLLPIGNLGRAKERAARRHVDLGRTAMGAGQSCPYRDATLLHQSNITDEPFLTYPNGMQAETQPIAKAFGLEERATRCASLTMVLPNGCSERSSAAAAASNGVVGTTPLFPVLSVRRGLETPQTKPLNGPAGTRVRRDVAMHHIAGLMLNGIESNSALINSGFDLDVHKPVI